ncbi:MAG TPA: HD domain-containing protein, partial [candidate division Zixibacteria bacterium]|nr:HD domain-containing protein [candidate division Zixibacteria bacterium]
LPKVREMRAGYPDAVVILMTAHPTVQTAISVLRRGAYDFLVKPFKLELLKSTIERALEHQRLARENVRLRGQVEFLKVANAHKAHIDIERYLRLVIESCKKELGAVAAGIIEVDPSSGDLLRKLCVVDDPLLEPLALDPTVLEKFSSAGRAEPVIEARRTQSKAGREVRLSILQPIMVRQRFHGVITLLVVSKFGRVTPGQLDVLAILTNSAAAAIANDKLYRDLRRSYLEAIRGLANAIEARDKYTAGHTDRVSRLAEMIARRLGWSESRIFDLHMGCTLHDIGKIGVPDRILNKPTALTEEERTQMRSHPEVGLRIIRGIELFKPAVPYIKAHHEWYDGTGYPKGLRGEEIPVEGRLLAVADTFDAILSDRPYRNGNSLAVAVRELLTYRGRQFDPEIVDVFLEILREGQIDFRRMYGRSEDVSCLIDEARAKREKETASA